MVHGGACLARLGDGTGLLVDGGIPGETVVAEVSGRRRSAWFARSVEVLEPSPHRVVPPCRYVPACGGCDLQHVEYAHQLRLKRDIVADALRRAGVDPPEPVGVHGMDDPWHYRWRGEFHVVPGQRGLPDASLGFNRARSWVPVAIEECLIHHRTINQCLPGLRDAVRRGGRAGLNVLRLTVGEGGDELLVRERPAGSLDAAAVDGTSLELPTGRRLGVLSTSLEWRGLSFRVLPETFIQVNWVQMDRLYQLVLDGLGPVRGRSIVDAYAGIGILGCHLAREGAAVLCIEENRLSATVGVRNAELNGVADRLRYRAEPAETELPLAAAEGPVDAVILDPPRAGCDGRVTAWLALAGPERLVYVSCDPATLARDLHVLATSGPYRIERLDLVDMFPQTHHIESVATLVRGGAADVRSSHGAAAGA